MIEVKDNTLQREIPSNLLQDKKVANMLAALQKSIDKRNEWIDRINYTMHLEDLPDEILDHLLWEKHITWKEGLALINSREQKINFIRNAITLHRLKGTPAAIELVCNLLNINTRLEEWFDYGGDPYHFKIDVMDINDRAVSEETFELLRMLVGEYKNVRSILERVNFYITSNATSYHACTTSVGLAHTVYPYILNDVVTEARLNQSAATSVGLEIEMNIEGSNANL